MKFTIAYPIKPKIVNQDYDEKGLLSYYKDNKIYFDGHNGIDYGAVHAAPVFAAHDGIAYYQIDASGGNGVVIRTHDKFEYKDGECYFKTIYWHLIDPLKEPKYASPVIGHNGMSVKQGDIIGYVNSTGLSTGDHLHFGLKPVLPGETDGTWYNIEQDNGYMGAINPNPYFSGEYGADIQIMKIQRGIISLLESLVKLLSKK